MTKPYFTLGTKEIGDSQRVKLTLIGHRGRGAVTLITGRMYKFRYLHQGEERFRQRECQAVFINKHPRESYAGGSLMLSGRPKFGDLELPVAHITQIAEVLDRSMPFANRKAPKVSVETETNAQIIAEGLKQELHQRPRVRLVEWLEDKEEDINLKLKNISKLRKEVERDKRTGYTVELRGLEQQRSATQGYLGALKDISLKLEKGEFIL